MNSILIRLANLFIGLLSMFPTHNIDIDLSPLTDFLPFLNYFIPFYLIFPILQFWFNALGLIVVLLISFQFFKKHL